MESANRFSRLGVTASVTTEALLFAGALVRHPGMVGAIAPASRWLSRAMTRAVQACGCSHVIEVGAGTGSITRAILASGMHLERYCAVERDPVLVDWLRARHPGIEVLCDCASCVLELIDTQRATAIVSSLPFRSLPAEQASRCASVFSQAVCASPGTVLIQYSYGLGDSPPFATSEENLRWTLFERVVLNLPPASIWLLQNTSP